MKVGLESTDHSYMKAGLEEQTAEELMDNTAGSQIHTADTDHTCYKQEIQSYIIIKFFQTIELLLHTFIEEPSWNTKKSESKSQH